MSPLSPTTTAIAPVMTLDATPGTPEPRPGPDPARLAALRGAAVAFEASFLAEMLKAAGFGRPIEGLGGGGAGEEAFASLLVREQATRMAEAGGIGLAESVFRALVAREGVVADLSDA